MPTTLLCEQGFFNLVLIKAKQRDSILRLDSLMTIALETRLRPRFEVLNRKITTAITLLICFAKATFLCMFYFDMNLFLINVVHQIKLVYFVLSIPFYS